MFVAFAVSLAVFGTVLIISLGPETYAKVDGLPVRSNSAEGTVVNLVEDSKK